MAKAIIWEGLSAKGKTATRGSVRKWIRIVLGKGVDNGRENCPLCKCFYYCDEGCPIAKQGYPGCIESPYTNWCKHAWAKHSMYGDNLRVACARCLALAKSELRFLAGFLPKSDKLQVQVAKVLKTKWADIKGRVKA